MSFVNIEERVDEPEEVIINDTTDNTIDDTIELKRNMNLFVKIDNSIRTRSLAKKYFGVLEDSKKNIIIDKFHVYCKICFTHFERKIHKYKKTVSSGNLLSHLTVAHDIESTSLSKERSDIRRFCPDRHYKTNNDNSSCKC